MSRDSGPLPIVSAQRYLLRGKPCRIDTGKWIACKKITPHLECLGVTGYNLSANRAISPLQQ
ncbi:MAG: hypothetical protein A2Y91_03010 [Chloroflexi bacterium RBG_13_54_8]|nr:MAG: hypothetical protein A2Y91_03010 [Chloroflexi bacterium RBG_13_54_8]